MTKKSTTVRGPNGKLLGVDENGDVFEVPEEKGKPKKPGSLPGQHASRIDPGQHAARIDPGQHASKIDPGQHAARVTPDDED